MMRSAVVLFVLLFAAMAAAADIRLGLVGTDTSHVIAFAGMLNDPSAPGHVPGARIVAAYKGGMPDNATSAKYIGQYTEELRTKWGVEIVPDIPALCSKVDGVLLTSVDGRTSKRRARYLPRGSLFGSISRWPPRSKTPVKLRGWRKKPECRGGPVPACVFPI